MTHEKKTREGLDALLSKGRVDTDKFIKTPGDLFDEWVSSDFTLTVTDRGIDKVRMTSKLILLAEGFQLCEEFRILRDGRRVDTGEEWAISETQMRHVETPFDAIVRGIVYELREYLRPGQFRPEYLTELNPGLPVVRDTDSKFFPGIFSVQAMTFFLWQMPKRLWRHGVIIYEERDGTWIFLKWRPQIRDYRLQLPQGSL